MRKIFILLLVLAGQWSGAAAPSASDRTVVIISLDGLAHFYLDDPKAEMPTLRKLAAEGVRAEKMWAVLPTVTWPNHTSIVTGVRPALHGVLGNSLFDREKGVSIPLIWDSILDKDQIIRVPTIYDVAKEAGLKTAAVTWPGSRNAHSLDLDRALRQPKRSLCPASRHAFLAVPELKAAGIPYRGMKPRFQARSWRRTRSQSRADLQS